MGYSQPLTAGATQSAAADAHGAPPGPPRAVITSTIVVLVVVLWLMLPTLVLADNWWSDRGELKDALKKAWDFNVALIGGVLAVIGGLLATSPQTRRDESLRKGRDAEHDEESDPDIPESFRKRRDAEHAEED